MPLFGHIICHHNQLGNLPLVCTGMQEKDRLDGHARERFLPCVELSISK